MINFFSVLIILIFSFVPIYANAETNKSILILNSYHKGFPWTDNIVEGVQEIFKKNLKSYRIYVEYMDSKITSYDDHYRELLFNIYKHKYTSEHLIAPVIIPEVIIATDDNALNFLLAYHTELFPNIPVVFCGVNNLEASKVVNRYLFTGILEIAGLQGTLDIILMLHPETKNVVIITDNTPSGKYQWNQLSVFFDKYPDIKFDRIDDTITIIEIENKLRNISDDSIVIFGTLYRDKTKRYITLEEGVVRLSKASKQPIYTFHKQVVDYGTIGGKLLGGIHHGEEAGKIALQIINGAKPSDIPIIDYTITQNIFNYKQLIRFGIKISDLPSESIILNVPGSFYEEHKLILWITIGITSFLIIIIVILSFDSVKRRRMTDALRKSEEKYRILVDLSPDAIVVLQDGHYKIVNKTFSTLFGYTQEDVNSKLDFFKLVQDKDIVRVRKQYEDRLSGKDLPKSLLIQLVTKDGNLVDCETTASLIKYHNRPADLVIMRDVSDRIEAQKKIQESEDRLRSFLNCTFEGICVIKDGNIIDCNKQFVDIIEYNIDEVIGTQIINFIHEDEKEEVRRNLQKNIDLEIPERRMVTKNGEVRYAEIHGEQTKFQGKDVIMASVRDITDKKRVEEDKLELQTRILHAQKMEAVGTLAGGVAHDFNNLLTAISGYSELMLDEKSQDHADYKRLQNIVHSVKRGSQLTNRLLTISSDIKTEKIPIDLNESVKEVVNLLSSTISKMIEIDVNLADTPQVIEADSGHLQQVLMNLVINSDHAMASGGKITISTKTKNIAERYIKPDYCSSTSTYPGKGEYVLLSVTDTGEGISKEELNYIFDPFFTTKQMGKGTGLGLTMVYEIVKNHSGYIICCSTIGKGTIFEIYFPTTKKQAKEDIKRDYAEIECGTETILVVDDEPYIRNICESALQNKSYNVITASNAIEGLNIYEEEKIDLVILDINMPGMGGNQCLEKLLELDPKAKVIMSSGSFTDEQQLQKESLSGAKKYISKPYNIQNLLSVIRYVLDS